MKRKIDRILGLFIIYLLIISPISFGQDENDFAANPTLENFNNLENPTIKDFSRLNPEDQIKYLNLNYRDDFAQKFYSNKDNVGKNENVDKQYFLNPKNIGNNPEADKKFLDDYGKTKAREFMTSGSLIEQNNAREIFALILSKNFPATFEIKEVGNKFEYDPITKILSNGGPGIPVNDPSIEKVTSILKAKKEGETKEYGLEIKRIGSEQGVQVFGNVKNTINLFEIDGREIISFIDADGQTQDFDVLPSREVTDKPTSFTIESDKTIIDGPAKGIINTKEGFREFRNHVGVLVLENNGNVQAHNAEVRGRDFLADGSYEKKGNIITARDHGYRDVGNLDKEGRTWIISLPSGMGSRTLNSDGTQTLHLNAINPKSRFAPKEEKPTQKTKEEIINQVKFFDPPRDDVCKPSAGSACKDSEVWFHTDENGVNTVSVKGPAEVGFYDVSAQQGARLIPRTPKFKGHDGLAQFDAQIHPQQVIADIQGKSTYSDEQYVIDEDAEIKDGIYTLQNAAAVRIVRRGINGADALFADCLTGGKVTCNPGERAVEIKKTIAIGRPTGITLWKEQKGREVLSEDGLISVTIALDVNEKGEKRYAFENLGVLGREHTEGKKVILGRDIMMSIPCGEKKTCGLQFGEDKETNAQGLIVPNGLVKAWYEEFDSQKDEVIGKRVPIDMTIGTVVGSHNILTTDKNIDNLRKMLTLIENRQFSQLSQLKLSFDKDPALQYFVFSETGLDIEQVVDPNYVKSMGNIAKRFDDAQEGIKSFNERNKNAGLQLDETGQAICSSKEECEKISERLNTIKQSRRGIDFDILTKIEENFARAKLDTVLSMYLACAGKPICDVKKEDVEKAKNEVVSVVNQRTLAWNEERARELRWKIKHEDNTGEAITEGKAIGEQVKKADDKENKANLEKNDIGKEIETNRKALDQLEEKKEYSIADEQIKEIIRQRLAALSERETELDKNIKDAQQQRKDAQRQRVRFATNNVDRPDLIAKMEDAGGCAACAKSVIEGSAFIPPELRGELLKEYEQKSKVQQNKGKTDFEALVQEVGVARLADQAVYLSDIDDAAGASALLNKVHELKSAGVKIPEGEFDRANQAVGTLFINKLKAQLQTINEFRSNKFAAMVDRTSGFEWDKSAWGNVVAGFDWITYESNLNPANWGQIFGVGMDTYGDKKTDQEIDAINQFQAEADRLALKAIGLERYINAGKTPQEYFNDLDKGKLDQSIVSKGLLGEKFKDFKDRSFGSGVGGTIDAYRIEANGNYLTPAQQADILLYNAQNKVRFNDGKTFMAEQDYNQIIRMGQSDAAISARMELDDLERESGYLSMSNKNFQKYGETIIAIAGDVSLAIPAAWIGSGLKAVGKTAAGIYLTEKIAAGAKATHTAIVGTELGAKTAEVLSRGVSAVQYWRATGAAKDALKAGIQDLSYARRAGAAAEDVAKAEKTVAALTNAAAEGHNLAKQASFLGKSWHFNKFTPKGSALATAEKEITRQAKEALAFSRKLDEAQQAKKLAEATMIADKSAVAVATTEKAKEVYNNAKAAFDAATESLNEANEFKAAIEIGETAVRTILKNKQGIVGELFRPRTFDKAQTLDALTEAQKVWNTGARTLEDAERLVNAKKAWDTVQTANRAIHVIDSIADVSNPEGQALKKQLDNVVAKGGEFYVEGGRVKVKLPDGTINKVKQEEIINNLLGKVDPKYFLEGQLDNAVRDAIPESSYVTAYEAKDNAATGSAGLKVSDDATTLPPPNRNPSLQMEGELPGSSPKTVNEGMENTVLGTSSEVHSARAAPEEVTRPIATKPVETDIPSRGNFLEADNPEYIDIYHQAVAFAGGVNADPIEIQQIFNIISQQRGYIGISGVKFKPLKGKIPSIPSNENWNNIVLGYERRTGPRLSEEAEEALIDNPYFIGKGNEYIVIGVADEAIPEIAKIVKTDIPINEKLVMKISQPAEFPLEGGVTAYISDFANTPQEQAEILNKLAKSGHAPHTYIPDTTLDVPVGVFYQERIEGENLNRLMNQKLTAEQRRRITFAADGLTNPSPEQVKKVTKIAKEQVYAEAFTNGQFNEFLPAMNELAKAQTSVGIIIKDQHFSNIILVETGDGYKAMIADAGFAQPVDISTPENLRALRIENGINAANTLLGKNPTVDINGFHWIRKNQRNAAALSGRAIGIIPGLINEELFPIVIT